MAKDTYAAFLEDQFAPIGGVSLRRMFGGLGIFRDGLMFALAVDEILYFKADAETVPLFEAEGSEPFSYDTKDGRRVIMAYRRAPERLFDDEDAFRTFAETAIGTARRAAAPKARGKSSARGKRKDSSAES